MAKTALALEELKTSDEGGFYLYDPRGATSQIPLRNWAAPKTIQVLTRIVQRFHGGMHNACLAPLVGIGDVSVQGGGQWPAQFPTKKTPYAHKSHQRGTDVDVRAFRTDRRPEPIKWSEPGYDGQLTRWFVQIALAEPEVRVILFNDPRIIELNRRVQYSSGHDDHLHLAFHA